MRKTDIKFDAPIPGENYTSDTKNYPWHRPPEKADYVDVVDHMVKKIGSPEGVGFVMTALNNGDTILDVVSGLVRVGVAKGRFGIDQGVLAAGPAAKFIEVLAKEAGVKAERGWQENPTIMTPERMDAYMSRKKLAPPAAEEPEMDNEPEEGLMSPPKGAMGAATQSAMLGYGDEEETV